MTVISELTCINGKKKSKSKCTDRFIVLRVDSEPLLQIEVKRSEL